MNDLRAQLAPGWSGVNIALTVVLFLLAWPLGLLMIGYVVWGRQLGLDFSRPETLSAFGSRLSHAWRGASEAWRRGPTLTSTRPDTGTPDRATDETLASERETLARERRAFDTERREWEARKREWHEGTGDERRERASGESLDS